jgi:hypothetical protein
MDVKYKIGRFGYKYERCTSLKNQLRCIWFSILLMLKPDKPNFEGVSIKALAKEDFWMALQGWELEF